MKKHFRHLTLFILYISLPALLTSCGSEKQAYVLQKVTIGTIRATCTATGTVNPLKTVLVGTQVSGKIKELHVDYNSPVTAGQLIAEIDPATFEAQLQQASANLISAQASLTKARASFTEAQRNLKRIHQLFAGGIIGQSDLDTAETNHAIAQSQVGVAGAQVVQTEATFNLAETNVKLTKIYSPVNGIVISRNVDIGQTVAASFQTPTLFSIAEDLRKMQINTNVDEADIGKIAVGQPAEFKVDAYPERLFAGRVQQIRNAPQVVQNVVTYDVVISADNKNFKLKPGMTANVTIIITKKPGVLRAPNAALRFRPAEADNIAPCKNCLWIIKNGNPASIELETGIDDYSYTEIISGDISEGLEVITGCITK